MTSTREKCLCERARADLEDSIKNPINYHPGDEADYGSKALRDVGDAERYYEDDKVRCECRKRSMAVSACTSSSSSVPNDEDMKPTPDELEAAKKARVEPSF